MHLRLIRRRLLIDQFPDANQCLLSFNTFFRRHESSYRRTRGKLNVKPDPVFLPSHNLIQDHVVFNPPSSAPNILHTPPKFLPKEDPRRRLFEITAAKTTPRGKLPPVMAKTMTDFPRHHLQEEDLAEIRRLHDEDPEMWTRRKLAKKFNCSAAFIRLVATGNKERTELHYKKLEVVKSTWGPIRMRAREDRRKRKELAKSDE